MLSRLRFCHRSPVAVHSIRLPVSPSQRRLASFLTMARTYDGALSRLASLQSNKTITALFDTPSRVASSAKQENGKTQDLNALAIPEMLTWLGRAGLSASDLSSRLRCIHVAGTKGKGSVCAYLTSIITQAAARPRAGRVGTYTSPHLITVRERIQLDGRPISQEQFARYFFEVWDAFTSSARAKAVSDGLHISDEELEGPGTKPFYFRFLTIMAFHVFLKEGVQSAIVECGIGGEYDSTNILPQEAVTATVITQLGIDHVGMLGRTLPEIAWHKAGICKKERRCFTRRLQGGDEERQAMQVLRQRAEVSQAQLVEVPDDAVRAWGGVQRGENGLSSLEGDFQKYNQALAVGAALEHLAVISSSSANRPGEKTLSWLHSSPEFCINGLKQASLRGRCETREDGNITWYIDGAHTSESLQEAAKWFAAKTTGASANKVLLFNQQDRDVAKLLRVLIGSSNSTSNGSGETTFEHAMFTTNEVQRVAEGESLRDTSVQHTAMACMQNLCPRTSSCVKASVEEALEQTRGLAREAEKSGKKTMVLATGSLYLVSAVLRSLEPEAET